MNPFSEPEGANQPSSGKETIKLLCIAVGCVLVAWLLVKGLELLF